MNTATKLRSMDLGSMAFGAGVIPRCSQRLCLFARKIPKQPSAVHVYFGGRKIQITLAVIGAVALLLAPQQCFAAMNSYLFPTLGGEPERHGAGMSPDVCRADTFNWSGFLDRRNDVSAILDRVVRFRAPQSSVDVPNARGWFHYLEARVLSDCGPLPKHTLSPSEESIKAAGVNNGSARSVLGLVKAAYCTLQEDMAGVAESKDIPVWSLTIGGREKSTWLVRSAEIDGEVLHGVVSGLSLELQFLCDARDCLDERGRGKPGKTFITQAGLRRQLARSIHSRLEQAGAGLFAQLLTTAETAVAAGANAAAHLHDGDQEYHEVWSFSRFREGTAGPPSGSARDYGGQCSSPLGSVEVNGTGPFCPGTAEGWTPKDCSECLATKWGEAPRTSEVLHKASWHSSCSSQCRNLGTTQYNSRAWISPTMYHQLPKSVPRDGSTARASLYRSRRATATAQLLLADLLDQVADRSLSTTLKADHASEFTATVRSWDERLLLRITTGPFFTDPPSSSGEMVASIVLRNRSIVGPGGQHPLIESHWDLILPVSLMMKVAGTPAGIFAAPKETTRQLHLHCKFEVSTLLPPELFVDADALARRDATESRLRSTLLRHAVESEDPRVVLLQPLSVDRRPLDPMHIELPAYAAGPGVAISSLQFALELNVSTACAGLESSDGNLAVGTCEDGPIMIQLREQLPLNQRYVGPCGSRELRDEANLNRSAHSWNRPIALCQSDEVRWDLFRSWYRSFLVQEPTSVRLDCGTVVSPAAPELSPVPTVVLSRSGSRTPPRSLSKDMHLDNDASFSIQLSQPAGNYDHLFLTATTTLGVVFVCAAELTRVALKFCGKRSCQK